ncbi:MAG: C_GCAxxG_C_C family protein [Eubacterium sp.]|nr:C_GCAxxG_C_C family protein [Eubacterium sp.]
MSKFVDRAKELRADEIKHYNCAQGALVPFAEAKGIDAETAYQIAGNFGAGMKRAATCGAVTGALMALGLYGVEDPAVIGEFYRRLKENHQGCLDCADLLRINKENGGNKKTHCDNMVYECVSLVEELLKK